MIRPEYAPAPVEGGGPSTAELTLSPQEFRQIAAMLHADSGIHIPESKSALVYARGWRGGCARSALRAFATIAPSSPERTASMSARRCSPR